MEKFRPPSRDQIAKLVGRDNPEMIRRLERMFQQSGVDLPIEIDSTAENNAAFEAAIRGIVDELYIRLTEGQVTPASQPVTPTDDLSPAYGSQSEPQISDFREVDTLPTSTLSSLSDVVHKQNITLTALLWDRSRRAWVSMPVTAEVLSPNVFGSVSDGDLIGWDGTQNAWSFKNGFTGTFGILDGRTVTVANGLITSVL